MELWRAVEPKAERPRVLDARSFGASIAIHLAFFAVCFGVASCSTREDEVVTPIDLTVVVVENLDGVENEPPPLEKPEPPPPPPPPPPPQPKPKPKEPEKPKELEKIVTNIVEKVEKKPEKKPEVKEPEKKPEDKPPEQPKKTKAELRRERIERMRQSATDTKRKVAPPKRPQPNGRTDRKTLTDAEIRKLLDAGYRPGASTNIAASEEQLCHSLIKRAFESKWDEPPWTDTLRPMVLRVWFGGGGRVLNFRLEQSSGDPKADATIKSAAGRVGSVDGLTVDFIEKYKGRGVPIRFTVKPN